MNKIDYNLQKVISLNSKNKDYLCLVYVNNIDFAKEYFVSNNIEIVKVYKFLNIITAKLSSDSIFCSSKLSFVDYIADTTSVMALTDISRKIAGIDKSIYTGKNVNVAVIDTGISKHFDFVIGKNRIIEFIDIVNGKKFPYDDNGHGTFVSGVLAGSGFISAGKYKGFAPNCNIISIKALDKNGEANTIKILDSFEWIYQNYKKYSIKVVCMSFGSEPLSYNDPIMIGAEKLWNKGITVVAAAGNSGPKFQTIKSPGISPKIITVGGFNDNRFDGKYDENFFEIAKFSSRGPAFSRIKPDLVAPSVDIISCGLNNNYTTLSGTSVAAPMIAGLCANIIQKYPNITPNQIKKYILSNCRAIVHDFNQEGFGYFLLQN